MIINKYYSYPEAVQDIKPLFADAKKTAKVDIDISEASNFKCKDILDIKTHSSMGSIVRYMLGAGIVALMISIYLIIKNIKKKRK